MLVRFDASHDSWELEDNVSEELAAAFRESQGGALAPRKQLNQQYEAGELGPEPKRRQRDGESSHEPAEERRPYGVSEERRPYEPKAFLPV